MLGLLIRKELRAIIQSPKFVGSFAVCSVLILLSVFTGVKEYQAAQNQYDTAVGLVDQELRSATSWGQVDSRAYRRPDPMQIFVSGLSYDIGRWSPINSEEGVKLRHSAYSDDPIFAVFRFVDFAFIVMFVLSLMAIQFTYDAVNGERESGTLRLVFSNSVPRAKYLIAKFAGSWLGLVVPLSIPVLISLLLVMVMGVPMTGVHWAKIGVLMLLSAALFTFFILLGVFVSVLARRSSVSFLTALLVWVAFVMIIPRSGVMAAGGLVDVPRVAEIEASREAFANEKWSDFYAEMTTGKWDACSATFDNVMDSVKNEIEGEIEDYSGRLTEEFRQSKIGQEELAWSLARISPASAYQLAVMALAETDTRSKVRNEDAMSSYREQFNQYTAAKMEEAGDAGGIRIQMAMGEDGSTSMKVDADRNRDGLDISDMPRFASPGLSLSEVIGPTVLDFGLLCFFSILAFAAAFVAFLKYDVR
jgi:ABC-type transport system involved in multi-copper enzyme maturation permease subunit